MPIGILGSLLICTVLYVAVAGVLTGLVPYTELGVADPIAKGVDVIGQTWFSVLIKIGALSGLTTVILVLLYGRSPHLLPDRQDGLLPRLFSDVHPSLGTPWKSQLLIGIVVAIVAALTSIDILGEMVSIGTLFAFVLVCGAVIPAQGAMPRSPDRSAPGVPVVPVLGIAFSLMLMVFLTLGNLVASHRLAGDRSCRCSPMAVALGAAQSEGTARSRPAEPGNGELPRDNLAVARRWVRHCRTHCNARHARIHFGT